MSFLDQAGEIGNSQVGEKEQIFGKQILAGPSRISGAQEEMFAWILSVCQASFLVAKVNGKAPFLSSSVPRPQPPTHQ